MRRQARAIAFLASLGLAVSAAAAGLDSLSNADATGGLKDALLQGAGKAVQQLGAPKGFLSNAKVRIPLPRTLQKAEKALRFAGMGPQADELVASMNTAAELAVNESLPVLTEAVKRMSVQDAKGILTGGDTAATEYFRKATSSTLAARFAPIVQKTTAKVQLGQQYNALAGRGVQLGLVKPEDADINSYVTRKALDGLFLVIGEQERAIRKDPIGAAKGLASKVFSAMGKSP
jgi:hypothetical protein